MSDVNSNESHNSNTSTGIDVSNKTSGSLFDYLGLTPDQLIKIALRSGLPGFGIFVVLWIALEAFAGSELSSVGLSTTTISAGISLLGLGAKISLSGSGDIGIVSGVANLTASGISLMFPTFIFVGTWFGLRSFVGQVSRKGLFIAAALGGGVVPILLSFLVSNSSSTEINGVALSGNVSVSVLRAVFISAVAAALATVRLDHHSMLARARRTLEMFRVIGIWLTVSAIVVFVVAAAYVALRAGSAVDGLGVTELVKLSLLAGGFVVLIVVAATNSLSTAVLLATGASIVSQGVTSFGGFFSGFLGQSESGTDSSSFSFNAPLWFSVIVLLIIVAAVVSISKNPSSELWYESAIIFGLAGAIVAIATRVTLSASGNLQLLDGSAVVSLGFEVLPSAIRLACLGAVLGLLQHPKVLPTTISVRNTVFSIISNVRNLVPSPLKRFVAGVTQKIDSKLSVISLVGKSRLAKIAISTVVGTVLVVFLAATAGKAIATIGGFFVTDPRDRAEEIADAFRSGDPTIPAKVAGIEEGRVIPSEGVQVTVEEEKSESSTYRSFTIRLSNGEVLASLQASKTSEGKEAKLRGLVPGWNVYSNASFPTLSFPYVDTSSFNLLVSGKKVTSTSLLVMPGKHSVKLESLSPGLIDGSETEIDVRSSFESNLAPTLTSAGQQAAIEATSSYILKCPGLDGCPEYSSYFGSYTTKSILSYPTSFSVKINNSGQVEVESEDSGTYEYEWQGSYSTYTYTSSYTVRSTISFASGQASVVKMSTSG
jgi:hypothetical protein